MKQVIRIIGGQYRGKKLSFPDVEGLRPTPDRVRETLFNWLMRDVQDVRCLDAFAGSGALGFEAFSRGASQVTFIEKDPSIHAHLKKTMLQFNSPKLSLLQMDSFQYLQKTTQSFDLIFLDPPFHSDLIQQCIQTLEVKSILKPQGLLYTESAEQLSLNEQHWRCLKSKRAGQVYYGLYERVV